MKFMRAILLMLTLLPLTACGLSGSSVSGKVLEENTGKPIDGAIVIVRWKGYVSAIVDAQTVCVHVESTTTDKRGNYKVGGWSKPSTMGPVFDVKPVVSAYKLGYGLPGNPAQKDEDVYLAPFTGTSGERLKYLERISGATECAEAGESVMNRLPLEKAIYEEAKTTARTQEDRKIVDTLLFGLESMEHGSMEALKRLTERRGRGQ